jgi:SAM-dependent methyltransferase
MIFDGDNLARTMRLLARTIEVFRTEGARSTATRMSAYLRRQYIAYRDHRSFDRKYGTETEIIESAYLAEVLSPHASSAVKYEASIWREFSRIMKAVPADPRTYTFIDVGCGKGRALLFADLLGYQRIIGIEFSERLAGIARHNIMKFRERRRSSSTIDLICRDALGYDFPDCPIVVYLYNPFGPDVMRPFTERLWRFIEQGHHDLFIAYRNPTCGDLFDVQPLLQIVRKTPDHAIYRARGSS